MTIKISPDFQSVNEPRLLGAMLRQYAQSWGFDGIVIAFPPGGASASLPKACELMSGCGRGRPGSGCAQDMACQTARYHLVPFLWSSLDPATAPSCSLARVREVVPQANRDLVGTIPVHAMHGGLLCVHVAADCPPDEFRSRFEAASPFLQAAAIGAFQRLIDLGAEDIGEVPLTERQRGVLFWVAQGKTNWEIGQILGISADTVRQHVMKIADSLKVSNRVQMATMAVTLGLSMFHR